MCSTIAYFVIFYSRGRSWMCPLSMRHINFPILPKHWWEPSQRDCDQTSFKISGSQPGVSEAKQTTGVSEFLFIASGQPRFVTFWSTTFYHSFWSWSFWPTASCHSLWSTTFSYRV